MKSRRGCLDVGSKKQREALDTSKESYMYRTYHIVACLYWLNHKYKQQADQLYHFFD